MTPDDATVFAAELTLLAEALGEPLSATRIQAYFGALADLPIDAVRASLRTAIRTRRFFPKPVELREEIEGTPDEHAQLAWAAVQRAYDSGWGYYHAISFHDPAIHATVTAMGGWSAFHHLGYRDIESVEVAVTRKQFLALFPIYKKRGAPAGTPESLCAGPRSMLESFEVWDARQALPSGVAQRALPEPPMAPETADEKAARLALTEARSGNADLDAVVRNLTRQSSLDETERPRRRQPPAPALVPVSEADQAAHRERIQRVVVPFRQQGGGQ